MFGDFGTWQCSHKVKILESELGTWRFKVFLPYIFMAFALLANSGTIQNSPGRERNETNSQKPILNLVPWIHIRSLLPDSSPQTGEVSDRGDWFLGTTTGWDIMLVFAGPTGYMWTSSGFPSLNWGIISYNFFYKVGDFPAVSNFDRSFLKLDRFIYN